MEEYLIFAKGIAYKAKEIMLKYFNNSGSSYKSDNTIVTKADKEINDYLIKKVKEVYKNHSVDGEENSFGKSNYVWVCDPNRWYSYVCKRHSYICIFPCISC